MKTLYLTDLDGTLLNGDSRLSENTINILGGLIEKGLCFSFATARSLSSASVVTKGLKLTVPAVLYNGGAVMDTVSGETVHRELFTPEEVSFIGEKLEEFKLKPAVYTVINGRERVSFDKQEITPGIQNYLNSRPGDKRMNPVKAADLFRGEPYYFLAIAKKEELEQLYLQLEEDPRFNVFLTMDIGGWWLEIMPKLTTKSNGAKRLMKMLNCEELVVFGDGLNDIPLFEWAHRAYAVENAVEKLKVMSTAVIGSNQEDAVARFIQADFKG